MIRAKPQYNIIYTFLTKDGRQCRLVFEGYNEKGRVLMRNLDFNTAVNMSADGFSYKYCKTLIKKEPLPETYPIKDNKKLIPEQHQLLTAEEVLAEEKRILLKLKNCERDVAERIESVIGRSARELSLELEKYFYVDGSNNSPYYPAWSDYMKIERLLVG